MGIYFCGSLKSSGLQAQLDPGPQISLSLSSFIRSDFIHIWWWPECPSKPPSIHHLNLAVNRRVTLPLQFQPKSQSWLPWLVSHISLGLQSALPEPFKIRGDVGLLRKLGSCYPKWGERWTLREGAGKQQILGNSRFRDKSGCKPGSVLFEMPGQVSVPSHGGA